MINPILVARYSMTLSPPFSSLKINITLATLLGLFPLVGMAVDLIAPSLPMIARELHTSDGFSKNLITFYLLGVIAGSLLIALLSDSYGRRPCLIGALTVFVGSSLLPVFFPDKTILIMSRFLQGATLAFYATMSRAVLSDLLSHERMMKIIPLTATMWGIGPIVGPIIGGYLQFYFNWRACFCFYAAFCFVGLGILLIVLPETHLKRHPLNLNQLMINYTEIISNHVFIGMILMMGLTYSLLITFNILGPFYIENKLGFSPLAYGKIAFSCGVIFLCGTVLCKHLIKSFEPKTIIKATLPLGFIIVTLALVMTFLNEKNIFSIVLITTLAMFFICGLLFPAAMTTAVTLFRHLAASASATMGLVNISITCVISWGISFLNDASPFSLISTYAVLIILSILVFQMTLRKDY